MFKKILIANRGEIAVRIIRACHEMGVIPVAVYSDTDANAMHVRLADEAVHLGPSPPDESYLRADKLIEAAISTGCEAIHPGYGFLSESPDFAQAVTDAGLIFIGPPPEAIRSMGVKTESRAIMSAAGVPVVPGFQSESASTEDFIKEAEKIGYPVMVKAAGGGGGKGIRVVTDSDDLVEAMESASREADNAFGDPTIFLERYIEQGRHIEFQVLADTQGNTLHLFERECSIQRRHQKIIEETPSPLLTPELRQQMGAAAVEAAKAVGYVNAGTVEFIVEPSGNFYFLEMNTRLQVEHPITELVTGIDLVKLQLQIAAGEAILFTQDDLSQRGHAIECRVYAEDPANNFFPAVGDILQSVEPTGMGIRVDSGVQTGDGVSIYYDPMIAKLIVLGMNREDAIRKMTEALGRYHILGLTTNMPFLMDVLNHPTFLNAKADTLFVDTHFSEWQPPDEGLPPQVLIAAALHEMLQSKQSQAPAETNSSGDAYSPWSRQDGYRMGGGA